MCVCNVKFYHQVCDVIINVNVSSCQLVAKTNENKSCFGLCKMAQCLKWLIFMWKCLRGEIFFSLWNVTCSARSSYNNNAKVVSFNCFLEKNCNVFVPPPSSMSTCVLWQEIELVQRNKSDLWLNVPSYCNSLIMFRVYKLQQWKAQYCSCYVTCE